MDDETLRQLVRSRTTNTPASRVDCPTPEALQDVVTTPRGDEPQLAVLEHVATCAPCRRDLDLLRTAHIAAPATKRAAIPRWVPLLAAASLLVVIASLMTRSDDAAVMRGGPTAGNEIPLLEPIRSAAGITLRWRSVPEALNYRLEVTDNAGNLVFSGETADTVLVTPMMAALGQDNSLRWAVVARLLDGSVRSSATVALPPAP